MHTIGMQDRSDAFVTHPLDADKAIAGDTPWNGTAAKEEQHSTITHSLPDTGILVSLPLDTD